MEQEYKQNAETKFGPSMHLNHSKLIENIIAEGPVKYQHATHHSEESCYRDQSCQSLRKYRQSSAREWSPKFNMN